MGKLENKVAIVTGAASGMGKSIAQLYVKEGAQVLLADYNFDGAKEVSDELNADGGKTEAMEIDVSKAEDVEAMFDKAVEVFGTVDILVNNAGIMDGFEPVGEITDERWDHIFDVNTKGVMRAMRKSVNYWMDNNKKGVIVNVISTGGLNGAHAGVAYGASKHAVVALTRNSAFMYAEKNIRVNGIAPGAVETNIGSSMTNMSEFGFSRAKLTHGLSPRTGKPDEIGEVAVFLASDDSSFVNGTVIVTDGGWTSGF
ncbi:SDR family oxidoreductase [Lacticigenium naphthae]|uniref:SDR family oxidoreductase n=1 Tax=Lacticigenium naphthae TaxID=515351 RepID=UPI0003F85E7E|nr:SDR family oxidoreductase [Lacticigenium naphthae]